MIPECLEGEPGSSGGSHLQILETLIVTDIVQVRSWKSGYGNQTELARELNQHV